LIHQGYWIFYQEYDGAIEILHVRHGARGEPLFKSIGLETGFAYSPQKNCPE
jgi:hypothetical protein